MLEGLFKCSSLVLSSSPQVGPNGLPVVLGDKFMSLFYTIFDMDHGRIGIAEIHDSAPTEIDRKRKKSEENGRKKLEGNTRKLMHSGCRPAQQRHRQ